MSNVALEYVGPHAEVEIAQTGQVVKRGATVEVPAAVAGAEPDKRLAEAHGELAGVAYDPEQWEKTRDLQAEIAGLDHGSGLLAQPDNWKRAHRAKSPDTKSEE